MKPLAAFWTLAVLAATAPLWPRPGSQAAAPAAEAASATANSVATFPEGLVPANATPVPLAPREARFARDFPGHLAVFATPDGRTFVLRHLRQPTRKLHPAADCLRAVGYAIAPRPLYIAPGGVEWSELHATRDAETLRVRERLLGADGRRWSDVSAWYWSAALGRSRGPWWSVTEIAPR